ncbi:mitochondrial ATP synthase g subunit-domain-containing protein [Melampsora americana]|nr:mitochondrial ATP synthase g subunit-domain-containing protein [Melampsora americana]
MMKSNAQIINQIKSTTFKRNSSNLTSMENLNQIKDKLIKLTQSNLKNQSKHLNQLQSKLPKNLNSKLNHSLASYTQTISYNLIFTKEILKQVYLKENLNPPNLNQIKLTYLQFFQNSTSLTFWKSLIDSGEYKRIGIYTLEAIGIFSIGEMIGRRHIVGYKLN